LPQSIDDGGKPQISGKSLWQAAHHKKKPVCALLPVSHVGEQNGGEILAVLLSPWQSLGILLSQGGRQHTTKIGVGIPEINQKVEPRTGYQINLQSGAKGKKILYRTNIFKIVSFKRPIRKFRKYSIGSH
jgi:hypothetical protein